MNYVEAWFDEHPDPGAIESDIFMLGKCELEIFSARDIFDTWMIKITFENAHQANHWSRKLRPVSDRMGVTQILIYKKLFLFQDLRF